MEFGRRLIRRQKDSTAATRELPLLIIQKWKVKTASQLQK